LKNLRRLKNVITLTMERLDHAVVLKLPTDHEHVMVALWRLGLNRDPHMYTLGELTQREKGHTSSAEHCRN
jgi:hypothetical protein